MQLFRRLANNIFFKIVLGFVLLSFVLFGISGFLLSNPSSWIAKIGDKTISTNEFEKTLRSQKESIISRNQGEEVLKYVESEKFKSDVLNRMVNLSMMEILQKDTGVIPDETLILKSIAQNESFKTDGKFNRELFKNFLNKNGLNEEKYVNMIQNELAASIVLTTLSMSSPVNVKSVAAIENLVKERRVADVIIISAKDVKSFQAPTIEEAKKHFEENKSKYFFPEERQISYVVFGKKDFHENVNIGEEEISSFYEQNKDSFKSPEKRSFYNVIFTDEKVATDFIKILDKEMSGKASISEVFEDLVKTKKISSDVKYSKIENVVKEKFFQEFSGEAFALKENSRTNILKSPFGFHVFLLAKIAPSSYSSLTSVKEEIKSQILLSKKEKIVDSKISQINDLSLTEKSLSDLAKKSGIKSAIQSIKISQENREEVAKTNKLEEFVEHAFEIKNNQISKVFYSKNSDSYYVLKVEKINEKREKTFDETKQNILSQLAEKNKSESFKKLSQSVADEVKAKPQDIQNIAAKHHLKFEKNREFQRMMETEFGGKKVMYKTNFLDNLFSLKTIGEATSLQSGPVSSVGEDFNIYKTPAMEKTNVVAVLRGIKKFQSSAVQIAQAKAREEENFRNEIMQEYNVFLSKKHAVEINKKYFQSEKQK